MATSWYDRPMLRKMKENAPTAGSTARDSRGKRAWPMEKVTSGCTVREITEVNASGA